MRARLRSAAVPGRSNVATSERLASTRAFYLPPPALRPPVRDLQVASPQWSPRLK